MAAAARRRSRDEHVASIIDEVLCGTIGARALPEPVARTLEALDHRRRGRIPASA
jgi:hypothetical protein